jgi:hypothetical protein
MIVQSILFPRDRWTVDSAKAWLATHDYIAPKVDATEHFFRFRQRHPRDFDPETFRNISISAAEGIEFIVGNLRPRKK